MGTSKNTKPGDVVARVGSGITLAQAQATHAELEALRRKRCKRTPETLVRRVEGRPDHPLRSYFQWDDAVAGHQFRLIQARELISAVRVLLPDRADPVKAYHSWRAGTPDAGKAREYHGHSETVSNPAALDQLSVETYGQIVALVKSASDAQLPNHDPAWRVICAAIFGNAPRAARATARTPTAGRRGKAA